jgi:hypothetical protein
MLERELREKEVVELGGWPFYAEPIELSENDAKRLQELYCQRKSFVPFYGFAACGGYHPDWCIKWNNGNKEYLVQFCFGCGEMKTFCGEVELHCHPWDEEQFEKILKPYRKQRPSWKETERLREKRRQSDQLHWIQSVSTSGGTLLRWNRQSVRSVGVDVRSDLRDS